MKNNMNIALCQGRHDIPQATDGYIFSKEVIDSFLKNKDFKALRREARSRVLESMPDHINLYVTGLSVALVEAIQVCRPFGLTLWHYDTPTGTYYPQEVS